jgi:hypothetical protein
MTLQKKIFCFFVLTFTFPSLAAVTFVSAGDNGEFGDVISQLPGDIADFRFPQQVYLGTKYIPNVGYQRQYAVSGGDDIFIVIQGRIQDQKTTQATKTNYVCCFVPYGSRQVTEVTQAETFKDYTFQVKRTQDLRLMQNLLLENLLSVDEFRYQRSNPAEWENPDPRGDPILVYRIVKVTGTVQENIRQNGQIVSRTRKVTFEF